MTVETIRFRGIVQGVGFRPTVARVAKRLGVDGWVQNDADGVLVAISGSPALRDAFVEQLRAELPPLANVLSVERKDAPNMAVGQGFSIVESHEGHPRTAVSPDAATCAACLAEITDPSARRYRYPFTTCTHCGPRFTIVTGIPYDRQRTTMASFPMCAACRTEYEDVTDRRYHAEPIACPDCGPQATLSRADGEALSWPGDPPIDAVEAAANLLQNGAIVAIKALGGYHLCCDATNEEAVQSLRDRKRRPSKPFALMATDLAMIERYCEVSDIERQALSAPESPIVLLTSLSADLTSPAARDRSIGEKERDQQNPAIVSPIAHGVAPGQRTLGFMLPSTPLHHLLMSRMGAPIVCTSGNLSEEPPCTDADDARVHLQGIADYYLDHDRGIAQRIDDSVVRSLDGAIRVMRRARGYSPSPLALPGGFEGAPRVLATGVQWKGTLCILQDGVAVLSQHLGDLDDLRTFAEWERTRAVLMELYEHAPEIVAVDMHPDYRSTRAGLEFAEDHGLLVASVQHHHAHVAACLAEHGVPRQAPSALGISLDGLGLGDDGALWGGEFLVASYASFTRFGTLKPVALLGGDLASLEPWRNLYAHLMAGVGWEELTRDFGDLQLTRHLVNKPRSLLDQALQSPSLAPLASSCGRLFDAVAAALGMFTDRVDHEGQAAIALEQAVSKQALSQALSEASRGEVYPFTIQRLPGDGLPYIEPALMWRSILRDIQLGEDPSIIAARFHVALGGGIVQMANMALAAHPEISTVALSGGVWQNRVLLEIVATRLRDRGARVLVPRKIPVNDGGIALGQAVIAAARALERNATCV